MAESVPTSDSTSPNFNGLRVAAFESRRADDMARLIERFGGAAHVSPSMREAPLEDQREAVDFAMRLVTGQIDFVIFMTGVGFKHLLAAVEKNMDRERFLNALRDTPTLARGPKPVAAMREAGITPTYKVPEPNTWRDVLKTIDANLSLANQTVGLQEYGMSNPSLIAGLEARGANVVSVAVYEWDFPLDTAPLEANVRAIAGGERDVALFTSAHQATNVLRMAERLQLGKELRRALRNMAVLSIGPTTSERLREYELPVDLEPSHPKMGHLVQEGAERAAAILHRKQKVSAMLASATAANDANNEHAPWYNGPFMKACRREPTEVTPVWLMRQAGRYMAEYREVRAKTTFLELCRNPQLCSEVMCTAVKRLGVDAAIIFSDLLPILEPMGFDLEFAHGEGPVIHNPVREAADVDRVLELESIDALDFVVETVKQTRADLPAHLPLIGFAGAPFTLASYAMEGGSSRNYLHTKTLMYRDPGAWHALMERLARAVTLYLNAQIAAGAQCVQLFDSWAGCLGVEDYRRYALPYVQQILQGLPAGVPVINFASGNPALVPLLAEGFAHSGCLPVVGLDWRIPLDEAWSLIGNKFAVQGNLDPCVLLAAREEIGRRVGEILDQAAERPGHIFNLGHGILQQTPVENAAAVVEWVHELSRK